MKNKRIVYLEALRVFASILVVMIHVASQNWKIADINSFDWQVMNIYDSFARVAVPLFVMISGAIFLNPERQIPIKNFYTKYAKHIFIIFIGWSLFYACMYAKTPKDFFTRFVGGHYHLWYLYMLIGLYMVTPLLKKICDDKKLVEYFLLLSLILTSFIPTIIKIPYFKWVSDPFGSLHYHFTLGYVSYYMAGYYFHHYDLNKKQRQIIYLLSVCGFLFTVLSTRYMSIANQTAYKGFYNNFMIGVVLEAVGLFVFFKNSQFKFEKPILWISNYSLGVYLVHIFVIDLLKKIGIHTLMMNAFISVPLLIIVVYGISFMISYVWKHVPLVDKYFL